MNHPPWAEGVTSWLYAHWVQAFAELAVLGFTSTGRDLELRHQSSWPNSSASKSYTIEVKPLMPGCRARYELRIPLSGNVGSVGNSVMRYDDWDMLKKDLIHMLEHDENHPCNSALTADRGTTS